MRWHVLLFDIDGINPGAIVSCIAGAAAHSVTSAKQALVGLKAAFARPHRTIGQLDMPAQLPATPARPDGRGTGRRAQRAIGDSLPLGAAMLDRIA